MKENESLKNHIEKFSWLWENNEPYPWEVKNIEQTKQNVR